MPGHVEHAHPGLTPPEPAEARDLTAALAIGLRDALTKDWPGDTQLRVAPAIAEYLMKRPEVLAALRADTARVPEGLRERVEIAVAAKPYDWLEEYSGPAGWDEAMTLVRAALATSPEQSEETT